MTLIIIIVVSFLVVLGIVLGAYLLITKNKKDELSGGSKLDVLTQGQPVGQDMFTQPMPQVENNPLMTDNSAPSAVNAPVSPVMNDILTPAFSDVQPTSPLVQTPDVSGQPRAEEVSQAAMEQDVAPLPEEGSNLNLGGGEAQQSDTETGMPDLQAQSPVMETFVASTESAPSTNPTEEVPLPPVNEMMPSSSENYTTGIEQPAEPQSVEAMEHETPNIPISENVQAPEGQKMAELSRGLNVNQTVASIEEGTEPPVKNI